MQTLDQRRLRLAAARLYFVTDAGVADSLVDSALAGGVDVLQLRDRDLEDEEVVETAARWKRLCDRRGALLFVNDRPELALAAGADGVHVGQDDVPVAAAREDAGGKLLVGLSTHTPMQLETGISAGADQLSVGPIWETPTKPGRPAAGIEFVRAATALRPPIPWFAIGGIDAQNISEVVEAGAGRAVIVRAIRDAADPRTAARELRAALEGKPVGSAA